MLRRWFQRKDDHSSPSHPRKAWRFHPGIEELEQRLVLDGHRIFQVVGYPAQITAGTAGRITVTALDDQGHTITDYTGKVHVSSTDPNAVLPQDYAYTAADQGVHIFKQIVFHTAGTQSLTVTDSTGMTGSEAGIAVSAAPALWIRFSNLPPNTVAGAAHAFNLTAYDVFNNVATSYTGTIHFSSSDPNVPSPLADYTFTSGSGAAFDNGTHLFTPGLVLETPGVQTFTATDTVVSSMTTTRVNYPVSFAWVAHQQPMAGTAGAESGALAGTPAQQLPIDVDTFVLDYKATFKATLSPSQEQGMRQLLFFLTHDSYVTDVRWVAYMLATVKRETGDTWQPIEEYGKGKGNAYGTAVQAPNGHFQTYYGRGYVQLTWESNYVKLGQALGMGNDLANDPQLALDPETAYQIMSYGMRTGSFTGVGLSRYINSTRTDYVNARRIINGMDHAKEIADNAVKLEALLVASEPAEVAVSTSPDASTLDAGATAGFTVRVTNRGPGPARDLVLSDQLPAGGGMDISWSIDPGSADATSFQIENGSLSLNGVTTLDPGESFSVHVTGTTSGADVDPNTLTGEFSNVATVTASNQSGSDQEREAVASVTIAAPKIAVTAVPDDGVIDTGQPAGFTLSVDNAGPGAATGVTLTDLLPSGTGGDITWSIDPATGNPAAFVLGDGNTLSLADGTTLAPGESLSVHLTGLTTPADVASSTPTASLTDTATLSAANEPVPDQGQQASASITVDGGPTWSDITNAFVQGVTQIAADSSSLANSIEQPLPDVNETLPQDLNLGQMLQSLLPQGLDPSALQDQLRQALQNAGFTVLYLSNVPNAQADLLRISRDLVLSPGSTLFTLKSQPNSSYWNAVNGQLSGSVSAQTGQVALHLELGVDLHNAKPDFFVADNTKLTFQGINGQGTDSTTVQIGDLPSVQVMATEQLGLQAAIGFTATNDHKVRIPDLLSSVSGSVSGSSDLSLQFSSQLPILGTPINWGLDLASTLQNGRITTTERLSFPSLDNILGQIEQDAGVILSSTLNNALSSFLGQDVAGIGSTLSTVLGTSQTPIDQIGSGAHARLNPDLFRQIITGVHAVPVLDISFAASGSWSLPQETLPLAEFSLGPVVVSANAALSAQASYSLVLDGQLTTAGFSFNSNSGLHLSGGASGDLQIKALLFGIIGGEVDAGISLSVGFDCTPTGNGLNVGFQLQVSAHVQAFVDANFLFFQIKVQIFNLSTTLVNINTQSPSSANPWTTAPVSAWGTIDHFFANLNDQDLGQMNLTEITALCNSPSQLSELSVAQLIAVENALVARSDHYSVWDQTDQSDAATLLAAIAQVPPAQLQGLSASEVAFLCSSDSLGRPNSLVLSVAQLAALLQNPNLTSAGFQAVIASTVPSKLQALATMPLPAAEIQAIKDQYWKDRALDQERVWECRGSIAGRAI